MSNYLNTDSNLVSRLDIYRWATNIVTNNKNSYLINEGSKSTKVAIIDSGIDIDHPELKDNIIINKSFIPGDSDIQDELGHGTMIAGEIVSKKLIKGIAPNISIGSYKVLSKDASKASWVIEAIVEAIDDNMDIINLSIGSYVSLETVEGNKLLQLYRKVIEYAHSKNCLVVCAAGTSAISKDISMNSLITNKSSEIYLPGALDSIITVAGTDKNNFISPYSNYGSCVNISAPSGNYILNKSQDNYSDMVLVTYPMTLEQSQLSLSLGFPKGYELIGGGTSIATPKVSATAALIVSEYERNFASKPGIKTIEEILFKGACTGGDDNNPLYYGKGIVNAYNSLRLINC